MYSITHACTLNYLYIGCTTFVFSACMCAPIKTYNVITTHGSMQLANSCPLYMYR